MLRCGIDIGGTFTDLVLVRDGVVASTAKTPTTAGDPAVGVSRGLRELLADHDPAGVLSVIHGTTLVANALIGRHGARTALVTTRGFRDVLQIGREHRYDLYDLRIELPEPLVPRRLRWELDERVLADGTVRKGVDLREVEGLADAASRLGVGAIAVCLLHSYAHAGHERAAGDALARRLPGVHVSLSSDVCPALGEYVRASTTVANAYVQPLTSRYLSRLDRTLGQAGVTAPVHVMLSTGGLTGVEEGAARPVSLVESGPAAAVMGAAFAGRHAGFADVLAFDMGGTTAKACLVEGGRPLVAREHEVARVYRFSPGSGLPVGLPAIGLIEIGAGGGSIARKDGVGLPKVGPDSAASDPGPACYGLGGTQATVTDADLLLGYLDAGSFLGGRMPLDVEAAAEAVGAFGRTLGLGLHEAAAGIHRVVNENMAAAARMHAVERGKDARRFTLVATGGAGPVHAWGVARALGIRRLVFPPQAGVASAFGMLTAPPAFDFAQSIPMRLDELDWDTVEAAVAGLLGRGASVLRRAGTPPDSVTHSVTVDMRAVGQGDTVPVPLGELGGGSPRLLLGRRFSAAYEALYGRTAPPTELELLTWRVRVEGPAPVVRPAGVAGPARADRGSRRVWSAETGAFVDAQVVPRAALAAGERVRGPAVVEEAESTAVIGAGGAGQLDSSGNLVVTLG